MVQTALIYTPAEKLSDREFISLMAGRGEVDTRTEEGVARFYLDSFDWRLFRAGTALEVVYRPNGYVVTWRKLKSGAPLVTLTMKGLPETADDFTAPGIRDRMDAILGRRTLQKRVSLKSREQEYAILDKQQKVIARLERRNERVYIGHSMKQIVLPEHVYFVPLRGYEDQLEKVRRRVCDKAKLRPVESDPIERVIEHLGIDPNQYSNRPAFDFDPDAPAMEVLREVQGAFLRIMEQNIGGACRGEDPEFLHDFLVAERRTRCMMVRYPDVFPVRGLAQIRQDLEWAESVATTVRDLDIYLELVDELLHKVDKAHRRNLKPLFHYLDGEKKREQRQMRVALESPRFKKMMVRWGDYLKADVPSHERPEEADTPIRRMVCLCVSGLFEELIEQGRRAIDGASDTGLCEVHQISKKLGYQLEVFQSVFPAGELQSVIDEHDQLQAGLNRFRNLHVQQKSLARYEQKMKLEQQAMPAALEAIDLLLARLSEERDAERHRVHKRLERFARKKNRRRFAAMFSDQAD